VTSAAPPFTAKISCRSSSSRADLEYIFGVAHEMEEMVRRVGSFDLLKGKILANLFYEPSTRTSSSFTSAMERLGGSVIPINEVRYSSVSKGESLPDTVRTLEAYADVIVLRHPEVGSAQNWPPNMPASRSSTLATASASTPPRPCSTCSPSRRAGQHRRADRHHGRRPEVRAHRALAGAPADALQRAPELRIARYPAHARAYRRGQRSNRAAGRVHTTLDAVLAESDVLYVTRVQKERFATRSSMKACQNAFVITPETCSQAKEA
jgi:aspartate carbamoyltransferase catalytic subunit